MTSMTIIVRSPREAHEAVNRLYQETIKPHTKTGAAMRITVETVNPVYRHQLRKAFHGPVLFDIAQQVQPIDSETGEVRRYSKAAWKEFFRDLFIPPAPKEITTRTGEIKVRMVKQSTEDLCDDDFALFILQVCAYACVELGVVFQDRNDDREDWQQC